MMKHGLLILGLLFLGACASKKDDETAKTVTKFVGCTPALQAQGQCIRWMDRKIYFAFSTAANPNRNNEFQKAKVKEALDEIQRTSMLGSGYFQYQEVDEGLLNPVIEAGLSANEYKSFILVWPDNVFNDFVVNELGGSVPDTNAVTVINAAFKRKFFMLIRASCFVSEAACNGITTPGLQALIARQLGLLSGIAPANCNTDPNDVMCTAFPTDTQWSETNKARWVSTFNNILEVILNNPNYYDEYVPTQ